MKLYKDTIHGKTARAGSRITAWALIRNWCRQNNKEVPTLDKIEEV